MKIIEKKFAGVWTYHRTVEPRHVRAELKELRAQGFEARSRAPRQSELTRAAAAETMKRAFGQV